MLKNKVRNYHGRRLRNVKLPNGSIRRQGLPGQVNEGLAREFNVSDKSAKELCQKREGLPLQHEPAINYWFASVASCGPVITGNASVLRRSSRTTPTRSSGTKSEHWLRFFRVSWKNSNMFLLALGRGANELSSVGGFKALASMLVAFVFLEIGLIFNEVDDLASLISAAIVIGVAVWATISLTGLPMRILKRFLAVLAVFVLALGWCSAGRGKLPDRGL